MGIGILTVPGGMVLPESITMEYYPIDEDDIVLSLRLRLTLGRSGPV